LRRNPPAAMSSPRLHRPNLILYAILRSIVRLLFRLLTRTEIRGAENVPKQGPFIVLTNHLSAIDPPLILAAIPATITVFAAHTHRHEFFVGRLMDAMGAIWVRRGEADREALSAAITVLKEGGVIGLAPEGTRSRTGGLLEGKIGAAYLASRADVPLVPVVLIGTEVGLPTVLRLGRPRITVLIGPPFRLPDSNPRASREQLQTYTDTIMWTLAKMLPEKYRGVYRDKV
jgi:1-acyl-sn-glycerol-3-phosphate acyltransferase